MMATRSAVLGSLLACVAGTACAPEEIEVAETSLAVVNGTIATGDENVVALVYDGNQFCTGTLVSPRVVVTAAHCVPPAVNLAIQEQTGTNPGIRFEDISIFFGSRVGQGGTTLAVASGSGHPGFSLNGIPDDIAVMALATDALVAPKPMVSGMLDVGSYRGATARFVGFGLATAGGVDNGVKREGTTVVLDADAASIYLDMAPSATCNGDSGGPLFLTLAGVETFVGVHSRSDCVDNGNDERVDRHLADFVQPFVIANADAPACLVDGVCDAGCATPDPDCTPGGPVCAADGACVEECAAGSDPDCGGGGGVGAGGAGDGGPDELTGGCTLAAGGGSRSGAGSAIVLALVGLVAVRRRRR